MNYSAIAIPATANRPAATEPAFLVAAPVKLDPDPVFDGETGVIGEPDPETDPKPDPEPDPKPEPEPELEPGPVAPVARGPDVPVPVANPVAPATPLELSLRLSRRPVVVIKVKSLT